LVTVSRGFTPGSHITGFQPVEATPSPVSSRRLVFRLDALAAKQTHPRRTPRHILRPARCGQGWLRDGGGAGGAVELWSCGAVAAVTGFIPGRTRVIRPRLTPISLP
jgi:hypothetical protein